MIGSTFSLVVSVDLDIVRSVQGDTSHAQPGSSSLASRNTLFSTTASPPPALSPPTAICLAAVPCLRRKRQAVKASSIAAGNGCSGASRYPTANVLILADRPASVTMRRWLRRDPEQ